MNTLRLREEGLGREHTAPAQPQWRSLVWQMPWDLTQFLLLQKKGGTRATGCQGPISPLDVGGPGTMCDLL